MTKNKIFWTAATLVAVFCLAATAQASLISYWTFDENGGTVAADSLPNQRDGTLSGDTAWMAGHTGGAGDYALDFDNNNDYVTVDTPHEFNFAKTEAFSAGVWINHDGVQSPQTTTCILSTFNSNPYNGWGICITGTTGTERKLKFEIDGGADSRSINADDSLAINQWVHVTATYDGLNAATSLKLYVNGVLANTTAAGTTIGDTLEDRSLSFGCYTADYSRDYSGLMDDVAIFDHELSATEVTALYNGDYLPDPVVLEPGDANGDTFVDSTDAAILAAHWLQSDVNWGDGDFNDDNIVNDIDATLMAANWYPDPGAAAVPEPSLLALLLGAGLFGLIARARRRQ